MQQVDIKDFKTNKLTVQIVPSNDVIRLNIRGSFEVKNTNDVIALYFDSVHDKIINSNVRLIELDITGLSFINSSGIATLVSWFMKIPLLPDDKKYLITILFNSKVHWQNNGLQVLKKIAGDQLVLIEV